MTMPLLAGTGVIIAALLLWASLRAYRRMVARADEARERDEGRSDWEALLVVLGLLILIAVVARVVWG